MTKPTKPILHNGFQITDKLSIQRRVERIFFTEVYLLNNEKYLYLFTDISKDEVLDRSKEYELITLSANGKVYLGVITENYSHEHVTDIINDLTVMSGFDSVAGMKDLKSLLINDVINPLRNPEKYKKFKLSIPNGILLYGPPGCGKTFLVKKLSEELNYNYTELSPSSVATPYIHGAVSNIAKVFEMAKLKAPSILFIDEIEGLVPKREELGSHAETKKEEINEFLLQLNNAGSNKVLVVGATNRPHIIDSAILRSGRMDKRIYVPPPDKEARKDMFQIFLFGRPYDKNIYFERLADMTENYVGSDIELIVTESARNAVINNKNLITEVMLLEAINKFKPSISKEEIDYFQQFQSLERW